MVIYANCAGGALLNMCSQHKFTRHRINVTLISNYPASDKIFDNHMDAIRNADFFVYQPIKRQTEWNPENILPKLKPDCKKIKILFYRFKGFWFNNDHIPYLEYDEKYTFAYHPKYYGVSRELLKYDNIAYENIYKTDFKETINKLHSPSEIKEYFYEKLDEFKTINKNVDIDMYDFFVRNYKSKQLFYDYAHPTNVFFYELFRKLIFMVLKTVLPETDKEFLDSLSLHENTHFAIPIMPQVAKTLELDFWEERFWVFFPQHRTKMSIYDYLYIRLSKDNLKSYILKQA